MRDIKTIYENNEQFHDYVIRHCRNSGDSIEQALRKNVIKEIAKEYEPKGINHREEVSHGTCTK